MTSETVEVDTRAIAAISLIVTISSLYAGLTVQVSNNRGISEIAGEIMDEIGEIGEMGKRGKRDKMGKMREIDKMSEVEEMEEMEERGNMREHGGLARRGDNNAHRGMTGWSLSGVVCGVSWSDRGISRCGVPGVIAWRRVTTGFAGEPQGIGVRCD